MRSYGTLLPIVFSTNEASRWDADVEFVPSGRLVGRKGKALFRFRRNVWCRRMLNYTLLSPFPKIISKLRLLNYPYVEKITARF